MTAPEPTPVTDDGDVIGLPPATPPEESEDIQPEEVPLVKEPPAMPVDSGAEDPGDL